MDAFLPGWETRLAPFPRMRKAAFPDDSLDAAGIGLRSARQGDLPALARLYALWRQPELLFAPWSTEEKRAFLNDQFQLQHAHYVRHFPKADFQVILDTRTGADGAVIGRLYLDRSSPEWRIIDILIDPALQGKGAGSTLLGWIQRSATTEGAHAVALSVEANSRARALYRRFDFEEVPGGDSLIQPMRWTPGAS
jgi:ribosomal protein S18 acetylase RimI-like enzyme